MRSVLKPDAMPVFTWRSGDTSLTSVPDAGGRVWLIAQDGVPAIILCCVQSAMDLRTR